MRYSTVSLLDFEKILSHHLKTKNLCRVNLVPPNDGSVTIILSTNSDYSAAFVTENEVQHRIVHTQHAGGTIVVFDDGITLATLQGRDQKPPTWMGDLKAFLERRGLKAHHAGNDMLVNGRKVCGSSTRSLGDTIFHGIHISIHADPGLISKICTKSTGKIPAGLSEFGITRQEVLNALNIEEE